MHFMWRVRIQVKAAKRASLGTLAALEGKARRQSGPNLKKHAGGSQKGKFLLCLSQASVAALCGSSCGPMVAQFDNV